MPWIAWQEWRRGIEDNITKTSSIEVISAQTGKRIDFIDLAKGVCILLVVFYHTGGAAYTPQIFGMLRMPLYLVLSGLFFKDYGGFTQLLVKKTNKVLVPFLFFYCLSYLLRYLLYFISPSLLVSGEVNILDLFIGHDIKNIALWFLMALFWCHLMFCAISLNVKREIHKALVVIIIWGVGAVLGRSQIILPCYIDCAMTCLPFFYFGYLLKRTSLLYPNKFDKYNVYFAVALLVVAVAVYCLTGRQKVDLSNNLIPSYWPIVMCGCVAFVLAVLLLCKMVKHVPFVSYFGRYSIIVLCVHAEINSIVKQLLNHFDIPLFPSLFILTLLLSWACIPLFKRYLPYVTAQKDLIRLPKGGQ